MRGYAGLDHASLVYLNALIGTSEVNYDNEKIVLVAELRQCNERYNTGAASTM